MSSPAAVLFDLDGTLVDSLADLAESMNEALGRMGLPQHPLAAYRYFVGDGVEMLVARALPAERRDSASMEECKACFRSIYNLRWDRKTRPYVGIPELLTALAARGVKLAVLSNKPHELTARIVETMLGGHRFAAVFGARQGVAKKPDPAAAQEIALLLGLAAERFLYLGDTGTDMQTAVAANMIPVGALWGFRPAEELRDNGAQHLIAQPEELLALL